MELTDSQQEELTMLTNGRWDPRRGVGRRLGKVKAWLAMVFIVLIIFGRFIPMILPVHPAWSGLYFVAAFGLLLCWLIPSGVRKRTKRKYFEHDGFLCPWCRYPLSGLADLGACPECGAGYERSVCVDLYHRAYRAYKPDIETMKRGDRQSWRRAIMLRDGMIQPSPQNDQPVDGL